MAAYLDLPVRQGVSTGFDSLCACNTCPLLARRQETWCPPQRPSWFNGLYILGEGPGTTEARLKQPFVGASGALLDELLEEIGIRRDQCFISNATSCQPAYEPPTKKDAERKARDERLRAAAQACHGRVRAEIEAMQPRVILALGGVALEALTGAWQERTEMVPLFADAHGRAIPCPRCEGERTLANFKCSHCGEHSVQYKADADFVGLEQEVHGRWVCEHCNTTHTRVKFASRKKRCPVCQGRKTQQRTDYLWRSPHKISAVNGMVFRGRYAADYEAMEPVARVDLPCHYLIATYHPSFLLRDPSTKAEKKQAGQFLIPSTRAHMRKAARLLVEDARWTFRHRVLPDHAIEAEAQTVGAPPRDVLEAVVLQPVLDELQQYLAQPALFYSVDIETDNKEWALVTDIRCVGFHRVLPDGTQDDSAVVVNVAGLPRQHPLVEAVCAHLLNPALHKAMQHGVYDIQVLWHLWKIDVEGYRYDTMVAHNSLYTDAPHDLQHITGCYTDAPPWKPPKKVNDSIRWESGAQLHAYNGRDVTNTSSSMLAMLPEMEREGSRFVHDLDVAMFHCARDMERAGLPVDRERWERWQARCDFYVDRAQTIAKQYIGRPDFDLSKPDHLAWAFYDRGGPCRFDVLEYTDTGAPATSKTAVLAYRHHPLVALMLDFRRWRDVRSRILGGFTVSQDWRIRMRWNALGARTGRWSSSPNGQNWSKKIEMLLSIYETLDVDGHGMGGPWRLPLFPGDEAFVDETAGKDKTHLKVPGVRELVVAPPGRKLVGADLSQAELRISAALSGDENLIAKCVYADESQKLEPDYDPHSYVAAIAFGSAYTSLDWRGNADHKLARERLRDLIKRVIYGLFYGAMGETILEAIYDGG